MSFQRMLMMSAREPRPYLPHPEDLICLYVPRWQTESDRAVLRDYSGHSRNMTLSNVTWTTSTLTLHPTTRGGWSGTSVGVLHDYTIAAWRTLAESSAERYGFRLARTAAQPIMLMESWRSPLQWFARSFGTTNTNIEINTSPFVWQRSESYMNQALVDSGVTETRDVRQIEFGGQWPPSWEKVHHLAVWRRRLTDDEIRMAQLFLSTASLEDYMMSRL